MTTSSLLIPRAVARVKADKHMRGRFREECGADGSIAEWVKSLDDEDRFELCLLWAEAEQRDLVRSQSLQRERAVKVSHEGGAREGRRDERDKRNARVAAMHEAAQVGARQAKAQLSAARRLADDASDSFASSVRIEWNDRELLDSKIARPDGTYTTWGEATVDDHRARIEMFRVNATANIEGAGRHIAAVRALEDSGAGTLNEMVGVAHV